VRSAVIISGSYQSDTCPQWVESGPSASMCVVGRKRNTNSYWTISGELSSVYRSVTTSGPKPEHLL
jgi:hypothetical protein